MPVKYKTVWLRVSRNVESIGIGDTVASFDYGKNQRVVLGILRKEDFNQPESDLTVADRTEIIFTKTPRDPEPKEAKNKTEWRIVLLTKAEMLERARQVAMFKKNGLKFYLVSGEKGPYPIDAYVVDDEARDRVIVVQGNIPRDKFLTVLGSMTKEKP